MKDIFKMMGSSSKDLPSLLEEVHLALAEEPKKSRKLLDSIFEFSDAPNATLIESYILTHYKAEKNKELTFFAEGYMEWKFAKPETLNLLGNAARKAGDLPRAERCYSAAINLKPAYEYPRYNIAAGLAKVKLFDEAVVKLIAPFKKQRNFQYPDFRYYTDLWLDITTEIQRQKGGDYEPADQEIFMEVQHKVTEAYVVPLEGEKKLHYQKMLYNQGLAALKIKENETALKSFVELDSSGCRLPYLQMLHALALFQNNKKEDAINVLSAIAVDSKDRYLLFNLGQMYKRANNTLLAFQFYIETARSLRGTNGLLGFEEIWDKIETLIEEKKNSEAFDMLAIIENETERTDVLKVRAEIMMGMNRMDEAMKILGGLLQIPTMRAFATDKLTELYSHYSNQGEIQYEQGGYNRAVQFFERALEIKRTPMILKKTAQMYQSLKNVGRARVLQEEYEYLNRIIEEKQTQEKIEKLILEGKAHFKDAAYEQAIRTFEEAFDMGVSKDAFNYLEKIFMFLNRKKALTSVQTDWNRKLKHLDLVKGQLKPFQGEKSLL